MASGENILASSESTENTVHVQNLLALTGSTTGILYDPFKNIAIALDWKNIKGFPSIKYNKINGSRTKIPKVKKEKIGDLKFFLTGIAKLIDLTEKQEFASIDGSFFGYHLYPGTPAECWAFVRETSHEILSVAEFADKHGLSHATVSRMCRENTICAEKKGNTWIIFD